MTNDPADLPSSTDLAQRCHPSCIVCGTRNGDSLGLRFEKGPDGTVVGTFACDGKYQGYPNRLHGGVIAMLADAAMTQWLFLHKIRAVTAKLKLRYPRPVDVGTVATIRAELTRKSPPLYGLKAEISQAGIVCVTAEALFIEQPESNLTDPTNGSCNAARN